MSERIYTDNVAEAEVKPATLAARVTVLEERLDRAYKLLEMHHDEAVKAEHRICKVERETGLLPP